MKNIYSLIVAVFTFTAAFGQVLPELNLNQPETGNVIREATSSVNLRSGFSYTSGRGETFIGRVASADEGTNNIPNYNNALGGDVTNPDADFYGSIQGSLDVNQLGGAAYTIPILVPPGTAGMQPQISIAYNSQAGNGLLGMKWNVAGLSAISRVNKNIAEDGVVANITFTNGDALALDGNRLLKLSDGSYMTANESFAKITVMGTLPNAWFKVENKDGQIFEYGNSTDSKVYISGDNTNPIAWRLNKITDANGNYMQFTYEIINNESVIRQITYTGNSKTSLQPYNSIVFNYTKRPDAVTQYIVKGNIYQANLLTSVVVSCEGIQSKEYQFDYDKYLPSRLVKITEKYADVSSSLSINWGGGAQRTIGGVPATFNNSNIYNFVGDFNGDGRAEILTYGTSGSKLTWKMLVVSPSQFIDVVMGNKIPFPISSGIDSESEKYVRVFDFNGDGKDDIMLCSILTERVDIGLHHETTTDYRFKIYISKGNSFELYRTIEFENPGAVYPFVGNFSGNGKQDLMFVIRKTEMEQNASNNNEYVYLFEYGVEDSKFCKNKYTAGSGRYAIALDYDGDGRLEILTRSSSSHSPRIYGIKDGTITHLGSLLPHTTPFLATLIGGDVNGDGPAELIGTTSIISPSYSIGTLDGNSYKFSEPVGLTPYYTSGNFRECGLFGNVVPGWGPIAQPLLFFDNFKENKNIIVNDFNGDGKVDILEVTSLAYRDYPVYDEWDYNKIVDRVQLGMTKLLLKLAGGGTRTASFDEINIIDAFGDFDGDGTIDFISKKLNIVYSFFHNFYEATDLVNSITDNNLNESINIHYARAANWTVHAKGTEAIFPYNDYAGPLPIVSSLEIPNGIGGKNKIEYSYTGLTIHKQGRGLLGFKSMSTKDVANGIVSTNTFTETTSAVKAWVLEKTSSSTTDGTLISEEEMTYDYSNPISGRKYGYNYLYSKKVKNYLLNTSQNTYYSYDSYGNILSSNLVVYDKVLLAGDDRVKVISNYNTYVSAGSWIPNKILTTNAILNMYGGRETPYYSRKTNYNYDSFGNLLSIVNDPNTPKAVTVTNTYNAYGLPKTTSISANNEETRTQTLGYDSKCRFITNTQNEVGQQLVLEFDPTLGNLLTETNITTGLTRKNIYNKYGQLQETISPDGVSTKISRKRVASNNPSFAKYYVLTETPGQAYQKVYYDGANRQLKSEVQGFDAKIYTEKAYNAKGQLLSESDPYKENGAKTNTTYEYDKYGRIKLTQYKDLKSTIAYEFRKETTTNPAGQSAIKILNVLGQIVSAIDTEGNKVDYVYHPSGQLQKAVSDGKTLIKMEYDEIGRQTSLEDLDAGKIKYSYDAFGQLTRQEDARGNISILKYDKFGRVIRKDVPEGIYMYSYSQANNSSNGLLQSVSGPDNMGQQYEYNKWGKVTTFTDVIQGEQFKTKYGYDSYGNVNLTSYPSGFTVENKYNKAGYLYEIKDAAASQSIWKMETSDKNGSILKFMNGNGLRTEYTYDAYQALTGIKTGNIQQVEYGFESPSRPLMNTRKDNMTNIHESFQYDNLNRLTNSHVNGSPSPIEVAYASNGNITSRSDVGSFTYRSDKIHAVDSIILNRNAISPVQQNITYNALNKVATVSEGNYRYTFAYGIDGERSRMFGYTNNNLTLEKTYTLNYEREKRGSQLTETHYIQTPSGTTAIFQKGNGSSGNIYYLCKDHLGSITALVNQSGEVVERFAYDPWGRRVNPNNWSDYNVVPSTLLSRGYTGHEHLDNVGLINMNGRMYDPFIGRMLSPDNLVPDPMSLGGYNRYSYCYNNPMMFTDPDGENPIPWIVGGGILLFKFLHDGAKANNNNWNPFKWNYKNANYIIGYSSDDHLVYGGIGWNSNYSTIIGFDGALGLGNINNGNINFTGGPDIKGLWNSQVARTFVPDFITVDAGVNAICYGGGGISFGFTWVTRGPEASLLPMITCNVNASTGVQMDATVNFEGATYLGNVSDIKRSMVQTYSFGGNGKAVTSNLSLGFPVLFKPAMNFGFSTDDESNISFIHRGSSIGVGVSTPFGFDGSYGARNTIILYDFYK